MKNADREILIFLSREVTFRPEGIYKLNNNNFVRFVHLRFCEWCAEVVFVNIHLAIFRLAASGSQPDGLNSCLSLWHTYIPLTVFYLRNCYGRHIIPVDNKLS